MVVGTRNLTANYVENMAIQLGCVTIDLIENFNHKINLKIKISAENSAFVTTSEDSIDHSWYIDSGASNHITRDLSKFKHQVGLQWN